MIDGWTLTPHAIGRALDMAADPAEIRKAITEPEDVHPSPADYPGCEMRSHGRICLAVNPELRTVITVMWATGGRMSREDDDELFWRDA